MTPKQFQSRLLDWHKQHGRTTLPWQKNINPYRVWISEIMLQQTQVTTVIPYYQRFIKSFPTIKKLASAPLDDVLAHWSGLGYYARARNLHRAAQIIVDQGWPDTVEGLSELPGIGRSTAGAILSFAMNTRAPILDGNVKRVLTRAYAIEGWAGNTAVTQQLWALAETLTPKKNIATYTQAIMDLGSLVCTRTKPKCHDCPMHNHCLAEAQGIQGELPTRKAKKLLPTKTTMMLILKNPNNEVLLEKRPPVGIWGGLWSLPEYQSIKAITRALSTVLQTTSTTLQSHESVKHSFSHFHLEITPVSVELPSIPTSIMDGNSKAWYNVADIHSLGLAAPVKRLLHSILKEKTHDI